MALARTVVSEGLIDELGRFEELVRSLSSEQWNTPSRCAGWTVGDVASHVIGSPDAPRPSSPTSAPR